MKEIISYKDVDCEKYKIIIGAFNSFYNQNLLIEALSIISNGTGYGDDYTRFTFWNDLDPYDKTFYSEKFEGVEVEYIYDTIVIDYESFYKYTKTAMVNFLEKFPKEKDHVEEILKNMKKNFGISNKMDNN